MWKLTRPEKSANNADSLGRLEKPSAFPQFPQALEPFFINFSSKKAGIDPP